MSEQRHFGYSIRLYGALVRLYPRAFGRRFGEEMKAAFARLLEDQSGRGRWSGRVRAWRIVLVELVPTLLREHAAAAGEAVRAGWRSRRLWNVVRFCLAALLPIASYVTLLGWTMGRRDVLILTLFFLPTCAAMVLARGRGWACSFGAVIGAILSVGLLVAITGLTEVTSPNIILLAPLLAASAATLALILATYVRLVIEGISLRASQGVQHAA